MDFLLWLLFWYVFLYLGPRVKELLEIVKEQGEADPRKMLYPESTSPSSKVIHLRDVRRRQRSKS